MASVLAFVFGLILAVLWIVSGGLLTQASVFLRDPSSKDPRLLRAYDITTWAAVITWLLVALFIILVILSIVGVVGLFSTGAGEAEAAEAKNSGGAVKTGASIATIIFFILALALVITTGILAAISANDIRQTLTSSTPNPIQVAYRDCVIAAGLCIGATLLLIIGGIVYLVISGRQKKKAQQALEEKRDAQKAEQELNLRMKLKQEQTLERVLEKKYQQNTDIFNT